MYKTKQWEGMRRHQLSLMPLCAGCISGGIVTQATEVDHVFPWQQIGEHAFFRNIYQSLCKQCHSSKTGAEKAGSCRLYGRPTKVYKVEEYDQVMRLTFDLPSAS